MTPAGALTWESPGAKVAPLHTRENAIRKANRALATVLVMRHRQHAHTVR